APAAAHRAPTHGDTNLLGAVTTQRLAVVGAGSMGAQIAEQAALGGIGVTLHDTRAEQLEKAAASNRSHLMRRVEKGKLADSDAEAALELVSMTTDLAD